MMVATAAMRQAFGLRQKEAQMSHRIVMIDGKPHLLVQQVALVVQGYGKLLMDRLSN